MSKLYFNSVEGTAEVHGSERANFAGLTRSFGSELLNPDMYAGLLLTAITATDHLHKIPHTGYAAAITWAQAFQNSIRAYDGFTFDIDGEKVNSSTMFSNTALLLGSDAIKLATRLHFQCELNCWVEGKNRAWLADIIENAPSTIFRPNSGWEEVIELLRSSDEGEVVISESIGSSFPNFYDNNRIHVEWDEDTEQEDVAYERAEEQWHELPRTEQWAGAMEWLRDQRGKRELKPEDWNTYTFGHGYNTLSFIEKLRENRAAR